MFNLLQEGSPMKLNQASLSVNSQTLKAKGYELPAYDRAAVTANTAAAPRWVHFGAGNIFRAFIAALAEKLLNSGSMDTGIMVAEGFDLEIVDAAYRPFDNLAVVATLCADGNIGRAIVGSVTHSLCMMPGSEDWKMLESAFRSPSLQMASLTITEKGYNYLATDGSVLPAVQADMNNRPAEAASYLGRIAALCHARYTAGAFPIAMVSMDNCSHNGSRLEAAMLAIADAWEEKDLCEKGFAAYLRDRQRVSFPWSMIDKITPRPDDSVRQMLEDDGLEDMGTRVTARRSFVAPFVNSEEAQYLVIEDAFPNGRPQLEEAGVIFTERDIVEAVETMKVCTCLNPLHTALAIVGCLLGFDRISAEMQDEDLRKLVEIIGYREGLPVVVDPGVIEPRDFIDEVIGKRFPNPFLQDAPQRIATDTSQKISVRFGNTIRKYMDAPDLKVTNLKLIGFVIAAWCRYLMAIDDNGESFVPSDDPLMGELAPLLTNVQLGQPCDVHAVLQPILSNATIMGVDLYEAGLAETVEKDFAELIIGPGAVRTVLHHRVST